MGMRGRRSARLCAGALFLLAAGLAADPLRIAAEGPAGGCPAGAGPLGLLRLTPGQSPPFDLSRCIVVLAIEDSSDAALDRTASLLSNLPAPFAVVLDFSRLPDREPEGEWLPRLPLVVKRLSSAARAAAPGVRIGLGFLPSAPPALRELLGSELRPYFDAIVLHATSDSFATGEDLPERWLLLPRAAAGSAAGQILGELEKPPSAEVTLFGLLSSREQAVTPEDLQTLSRLQSYWTDDVSRDPTPTTARRRDGSSFDVPRFFDAKKLTPILFLPEDLSGGAETGLSGGPFAKASVENLATGGRRDFDLKGAPALTLDLARGPLAVVLQPAARGGEQRATVEVGAARGLTAEEIVARERAWDSGQREKVKAFVAEMNTSLRFRIAEVNETFDLTIRGPLLFRRGESSDWAWHEFFLNGVRWKGRTLPKVPILQPEKVTVLPLNIRLTEDYDYALHGETRIGGRRAYHILFTPKSTVGDKPIYRGSAWIDTKTFALLRRDSVQLNLKGDALSNVQNEYYRPVPGRPDVVLPLEIRGEQVFSTAGRTTAIEMQVAMTAVAINPEDFDARRREAYASPSQMVRDTQKGLRYLVPDPSQPGMRIPEEKVSRKSTFGLLGAFYDDSLSYPIPLIGLQHFNFDLWGRGKQASVFFGGALLTANYTDPGLAGSRFDLGADLFAIAVPFGDVAYHNGQEVPGEKIKHLPAVLQFNLGRPLGPYLKAGLGIFTKWDNYQRDKDTGPNFRVPMDTFTDGAELKLVSNFSGFSATVSGSYFRRRKWEPWGDPTTSEYSPNQKDYWKYSFSISKDRYFSGFRKLHLSLAYLGGSDLDRFSKYEFGAFSGNPIRGFKSGSLRTESALLAGLSYGLNIEDIIRFEGFYDQALMNDSRSGFHHTYFSGAGLLASVNGPWTNSLVRAEVGVPVVRHGVNGFVVNAIMLKLF